MVAAGVWIADWFGIHLREWKSIVALGLLLAAATAFSAAVVLAAMAYDSRGMQRALRALADALGGKLVDQPAPEQLALARRQGDLRRHRDCAADGLAALRQRRRGRHGLDRVDRPRAQYATGPIGTRLVP